MSDDLSDFGAALGKLCVKAANDARSSANPIDAFGDMVERLAFALGATIAWAAQGKPEAIDDLLTGAEGYAAEEAARIAPLARLATLRRAAQ